MDFYALQQKLFALDPVDPKEDLARLRSQAQGSNTAPVLESIDYLNESVDVPEGSLKMDRDYSVNDFAALAGVVVEKKQRDADQVRGKEPMPKAEPGRTKHPFQDRLVGEDEINELEVVPRTTNTNINQTLASIQSQLQTLSQTIQQLQSSIQQMSQQPQQQRSTNPNRQTMSLSQMPSMDLNSKQNNKTKLESVDSIKETLFAALNKKMGN
jgi:paraquat-inducible protein B